MNPIEHIYLPDKKPDFNLIKEKASFYSNGKLHFCILKHGTLIASRVKINQVEFIQAIFNKSLQGMPDFFVQRMKDGNFSIQFKDPIYSIVIKSDFESNQKNILANLEALKIKGEHFIIRDNSEEEKENLLVGLLARARLFADLKHIEIIDIIEPTAL